MLQTPEDETLKESSLLYLLTYLLSMSISYIGSASALLVVPSLLKEKKKSASVYGLACGLSY